ncbi:MAG TPA: hypothetical protein VHM70_19355 [Polyangiaceae bacterium]|jgi:hypothetical protein|nr:hypothetical protein [Polyangiaceae bacterium]
MLPQQLAFGTPRRLPKASQLDGDVAVLDIAFAAGGKGGGFEDVTLPLITGLGPRLRAWVDHHDHDLHPRYATDPRFILCTKAEHGACPEMIHPELVERIGKVDTIVCHTDFDGLASAAKWMRKGQEPYLGCDRDAWCIDTRLAKPTQVGERIDRALRARPRDYGLFGLVVRHLYEGLTDPGLWAPIDSAAAELLVIEQQTRKAAHAYAIVPPSVAIVDVRSGYGNLDKTLLLLLGQERAKVSVVIDVHNVSVAARFDSGFNFLELFGLTGGMPTRVSLPHKHLPQILTALGVSHADQSMYL